MRYSVGILGKAAESLRKWFRAYHSRELESTGIQTGIVAPWKFELNKLLCLQILGAWESAYLRVSLKRCYHAYDACINKNSDLNAKVRNFKRGNSSIAQ